MPPTLYAGAKLADEAAVKAQVAKELRLKRLQQVRNQSRRAALEQCDAYRDTLGQLKASKAAAVREEELRRRAEEVVQAELTWKAALVQTGTAQRDASARVRQEVLDKRNERRRREQQEAAVRARFEAAIQVQRAPSVLREVQEQQLRVAVDAKRDIAAHDREAASAHAAMVQATEAARAAAAEAARDPLAPVVIAKPSVFRNDVRVMHRHYVKVDAKVIRHHPNANVADRWAVVNQAEEAVQTTLADLRKAVMRELRSRWREEERVVAAIQKSSERKREDWFVTSTKALDQIDRSSGRTNRVRSVRDVMRLAQHKMIEVADDRELLSNFDDMLMDAAASADGRGATTPSRKARTATAAMASPDSVRGAMEAMSPEHNKQQQQQQRYKQQLHLHDEGSVHTTSFSMNTSLDSAGSLSSQILHQMLNEDKDGGGEAFDGFKCQRLDGPVFANEDATKKGAATTANSSPGMGALRSQLSAAMFQEEVEKEKGGKERAEQNRLALQAETLPVFTSASAAAAFDDAASTSTSGAFGATVTVGDVPIRPWRVHGSSGSSGKAASGGAAARDTIAVKSGGRIHVHGIASAPDAFRSHAYHNTRGGSSSSDMDNQPAPIMVQEWRNYTTNAAGIASSSRAMSPTYSAKATTTSSYWEVDDSAPRASLLPPPEPLPALHADDFDELPLRRAAATGKGTKPRHTGVVRPEGGELDDAVHASLDHSDDDQMPRFSSSVVVTDGDDDMWLGAPRHGGLHSPVPTHEQPNAPSAGIVGAEKAPMEEKSGTGREFDVSSSSPSSVYSSSVSETASSSQSEGEEEEDERVLSEMVTEGNTSIHRRHGLADSQEGDAMENLLLMMGGGKARSPEVSPPAPPPPSSYYYYLQQYQQEQEQEQNDQQGDGGATDLTDEEAEGRNAGDRDMRVLRRMVAELREPRGIDTAGPSTAVFSSDSGQVPPAPLPFDDSYSSSPASSRSTRSSSAKHSTTSTSSSGSAAGKDSAGNGTYAKSTTSDDDSLKIDPVLLDGYLTSAAAPEQPSLKGARQSTSPSLPRNHHAVATSNATVTTTNSANMGTGSSSAPALPLLTLRITPDTSMDVSAALDASHITDASWVRAHSQPLDRSSAEESTVLARHDAQDRAGVNASATSINNSSIDSSFDYGALVMTNTSANGLSRLQRKQALNDSVNSTSSRNDAGSEIGLDDVLARADDMLQTKPSDANSAIINSDVNISGVSMATARPANGTGLPPSPLKHTFSPDMNDSISSSSHSSSAGNSGNAGEEKARADGHVSSSDTSFHSVEEDAPHDIARPSSSAAGRLSEPSTAAAEAATGNGFDEDDDGEFPESGAQDYEIAGEDDDDSAIDEEAEEDSFSFPTRQQQQHQSSPKLLYSSPAVPAFSPPPPPSLASATGTDRKAAERTIVNETEAEMDWERIMNARADSASVSSNLGSVSDNGSASQQAARGEWLPEVPRMAVQNSGFASNVTATSTSPLREINPRKGAPLPDRDELRSGGSPSDSLAFALSLSDSFDPALTASILSPGGMGAAASSGGVGGAGSDLSLQDLLRGVELSDDEDQRAVGNESSFDILEHSSDAGQTDRRDTLSRRMDDDEDALLEAEFDSLLRRAASSIAAPLMSSPNSSTLSAGNSSSSRGDHSISRDVLSIFATSPRGGASPSSAKNGPRDENNDSVIDDEESDRTGASSLGSLEDVLSPEVRALLLSDRRSSVEATASAGRYDGPRDDDDEDDEDTSEVLGGLEGRLRNLEQGLSKYDLRTRPGKERAKKGSSGGREAFEDSSSVSSSATPSLSGVLYYHSAGATASATGTRGGFETAVGSRQQASDLSTSSSVDSDSLDAILDRANMNAKSSISNATATAARSSTFDQLLATDTSSSGNSSTVDANRVVENRSASASTTTTSSGTLFSNDPSSLTFLDRHELTAQLQQTREHVVSSLRAVTSTSKGQGDGVVASRSKSGNTAGTSTNASGSKSRSSPGVTATTKAGTPKTAASAVAASPRRSSGAASASTSGSTAALASISVHRERVSPSGRNATRRTIASSVSTATASASKTPGKVLDVVEKEELDIVTGTERDVKDKNALLESLLHSDSDMASEPSVSVASSLDFSVVGAMQTMTMRRNDATGSSTAKAAVTSRVSKASTTAHLDSPSSSPAVGAAPQDLSAYSLGALLGHEEEDVGTEDGDEIGEVLGRTGRPRDSTATGSAKTPSSASPAAVNITRQIGASPAPPPNVSTRRRRQTQSSVKR